MMSVNLWILLATACILSVLARVTRPKWADATLWLSRWMAGMRRHSIKIDDHDIVFYEAGRPDAFPILMLHGFGGDAHNWLRMVPLLKSRYRVIVPDLPGFGETGAQPEKSYGLLAQLSRLSDFVNALQLARFHLMGNSMGGGLAAAFAADHPERVASLALFNAAGVAMPKHSPYVESVLAGHNPLLIRNRDDFESLLALVSHRKPWLPEYMKEALTRERIAVADEQNVIFQEIFSTPDILAGRLPLVSAPTLILWGDDDRILDISCIQSFRTGVPHAEVAVLPDCGHVPMLEKPDETARIWNKFIADVEA